MAHNFTLRRGFKVDLDGAPEDSIHDAPPVTGAALLGTDCPGLRAAFEVAAGDRVKLGQVLFRDRKRPRIAFVAPVSGTVVGIDYGPRRSLSALRIACGADDSAEKTDAADQTSVDPRELLLSRGFWPAFRSRPFGRIPDPDAIPAAIFVRAIDTHPLAPNPLNVLGSAKAEFGKGLTALTELTDGPVYLCQAPGPDLAKPIAGVEIARFAGPHPAGLSGTHIQYLHKKSVSAPVWTIGYQDVLAIGRLLETGAYVPERVISLAGPRVTRPRLLRTVLGASLRDLTEGEIEPDGDGYTARLIAGSVLSGHEAAYLGCETVQISVIDAPGRSAASIFARWFADKRAPVGPRPIVPTTALERAAPPGIVAPVPLLRALSVGDSEAAARHGALGLIEEDMALLSNVCTSQSDYGVLLRRVLDELEDAV